MPTGFESNELFPDDMPEKNNDILGADEDDALWTLLSVYADGEATPEEAAQVEALLQSDPAIARELSFFQMSAETVHSLAEVEPPAFLQDSILSATTRRKTATQKALAWCSNLVRSFTPANTMRYAFAGGAVAAGLLAVLFFSRHSGAPPVTSSGGIANPPQIVQTEKSKPGLPEKSKPQPEILANNTKSAMRPLLNAHPGSVNGNEGKQTRETQLVKNMLAPKPTSKSPTVGPNLPKHNDSRLVVNNKNDGGTGGGTAPITIAKLTGDLESRNQHKTADAGKPNNPDDLGWSLKTGGEEGDTSPKNPVQPAVLVKNDPDTGVAESQPKVTYGALKIPARPPLYVRANAEIKKEAEAQRGGYNAETLKGIERHEVTVSLIGGKF